MKAWALLLLLSGPAPSATPEKAAVAAERPSEKAADRIPAISERVKDIPRRDGFLPFYWDARKGQLLLEIPPGMGEFLYGSGLAGGAGSPDISPCPRHPRGLRGCRVVRGGPTGLPHPKQMPHRGAVSAPDPAR